MNTLLLGLALALGAPALKDKGPPPPGLVGEWVIEQATVGGTPSPPGPNSNRWVFNADGSRTIIGPNGSQIFVGRYTTEPKKGNLDLNGRQQTDAVYRCLYKLDGDTLTLNVGWQNETRPTAFESPAGSKYTLYVMKRVKTKD